MTMDMKTQQYISNLDNLKNLISGIEDEEVISSLVKLLCVRTAGLLEIFLKTRISEYSKGKVPQEINHFMTDKFKDITNLSSSKLTKVLNSFSSDWEGRFSAYLIEHEQKKISLDSTISQRHCIAHGQASNINQASMSQYYEDIKQIVIFLDGIIR